MLSEFTSIVAGSWDRNNSAFADTALDHPIKSMEHADQANAVYAEGSPWCLTLSETMIAAVITEYDAVYNTIGTDPETRTPGSRTLWGLSGQGSRLSSNRAGIRVHGTEHTVWDLRRDHDPEVQVSQV